MTERRFRLSVSPENAGGVRRVLELGGKSSLADLHQAILHSFSISGELADEPYAFFTSGRFWDRSSAYVDRRVEGRHADKALLFRLGLGVGKRVAYLLDLVNERRFEVTVLAVDEVPEPLPSPRLIESAGELPDLDEEPSSPSGEQEPRELSGLVELAEKFLDLDDELEPFADTLAAARARREPWDDDERALRGLASFKAEGELPALPPEARATFRAAASAARELIDALGGQRRSFGQLDEWLLSRALGTRLLDFPRSLALAGEAELAIELARAMAFLDPELLKGDVAIMLAESGQRQAALAVVDELLSQARDAALVEAKAGDTHRALGDLAAAEAYYRRSLAVAESPSDRLHALLRLVACLTDAGREVEAQEVLDSARKAREPAPKVPVGRNEPCPCGSGKKYKKCHGA